MAGGWQPYGLAVERATTRGFRSTFGIGPVRLSKPAGGTKGFRSCFGFGPVRFCSVTTETGESGSGSARSQDDFSLSYINARKRREAEEQEAMAAFAAFMMTLD